LGEAGAREQSHRKTYQQPSQSLPAATPVQRFCRKMKRIKTGQSCKILFPVFGGKMVMAKIQTVKGLRVEIFSRPLRKNTTRPLTVRIGGTDGKRKLLFYIGYGIISPIYTDKSEK